MVVKCCQTVHCIVRTGTEVVVCAHVSTDTASLCVSLGQLAFLCMLMELAAQVNRSHQKWALAAAKRSQVESNALQTETSTTPRRPRRPSSRWKVAMHAISTSRAPVIDTTLSESTFRWLFARGGLLMAVSPAMCCC